MIASNDRKPTAAELKIIEQRAKVSHVKNLMEAQLNGWKVRLTSTIHQSL
jgi:hypothetical protein